MRNGIDIDRDTLQSLLKSCLLELNNLKFDLTKIEVERLNDNSDERIKELEKDIIEKEKEISVIKFKSDEELNQLRGKLEEKDLVIKNQEDRIYELDYVTNSLDEIKTYFAQQLKEYKRSELFEVNERLNESYKHIAEKEAKINALSRTIDDYKIQVIKLENDSAAQQRIMELENQIELKIKEIEKKDEEISSIDNQLNLLRQQSIPKQEYDDLKIRFNDEISAMDDELTYLKEQTIPKENYIDLQNKLEDEITAMDHEIKFLKEKTIPREEYVNLQNLMENEISIRDNELKHLREETIPKSEYITLQNQLQNEIISRENELNRLSEQSVSREEYINLQNELIRKNDKIKRLEEINAFFNELQEEQESYGTMDRTPPFRLEKRERR